MSKPLRVLIVEDSKDDAELLLLELQRGGYDITSHRVDTPEAMKTALDGREWDVIISDYKMPAFDGLAAFKLVQEKGFDLPFIIVSGTIGEDTAVEALKAGVHDYLIKGKLARLLPALERELRDAEARRERVKLEDQFRQAQKMEAIGQLAGGIAHDFNNLLMIISGYSQLLLMEDLAGQEKARQRAQGIVDAAERASSLTRQLLAFSRKQVLEPKVLDLNAVFSDVEKMLRRLIGEDIELVAIAREGLWRVRVDPGQMEQVILNLAVNARDAMPRGGMLTLETANVDLDESYAATHPEVTPGPHAMLSVSDNGEGMDPETLSRIFEPFFTTKELGKGTGLGLATVHGIVKQSGGHIWVYSEPGQGTTFKLYLPQVKEEVDEAETAERTAEVARGTETILLVEDDAGVRALLREVLAGGGYTVLEAENGEEALKVAGKHAGEIALMITDVVMPRMSGPELAGRMEAVRPRIKIVYMSGYTENAIGHHGVLEKGLAFLQKPCSPRALLRKVRELLDE